MVNPARLAEVAALFSALSLGSLVAVFSIWRHAAAFDGSESSRGKDPSWAGMSLAASCLSAAFFFLALGGELETALAAALPPGMAKWTGSIGAWASSLCAAAAMAASSLVFKDFVERLSEGRLSMGFSRGAGLAVSGGLFWAAATLAPTPAAFVSMCGGLILLGSAAALGWWANGAGAGRVASAATGLSACGGALLFSGYLEESLTQALSCGLLAGFASALLHGRVGDLSSGKVKGSDPWRGAAWFALSAGVFWLFAATGFAGSDRSAVPMALSGALASSSILWRRFRDIQLGVGNFIERARADAANGLLRGVCAAAYLVDEKGRIEALSEKGAELAGIDSEFVLGKQVRELFNMGDSWPASEDWWRHESRDDAGLGPRALLFERSELGDGSSRSVVTVSDVTAEREAVASLDRLAKTDALTGLPNRREAMSRLAARCGGEEAFAIAFADLDHFKNANDTEGHGFGDALLKEIGAKFDESAKRLGGWCSRLGGDEFLFCLPPGTGELEAQQLGARLSRDIERVEGAKRFSMGVSLGAALYPKDGGDPETLVKHADAALYSAKEKGRGRTEVYGEGLEAAVRRRVKVERALRSCLASGMGLRMYCQPVVSMKDFSIKACECLLRFEDEDLKEAGTFFVVSSAEASGQIIPLGRWVLDSALKVAEELERRGSKTVVALNLSARQFSDDYVWTRLGNWAGSRGGAKGLVKVEVTESAVADDFERARNLLEGVRAAGFGVALDDFGTGYSSLSTLRSLPFSQMKIDKSLMDDVDASNQAGRVALAALALAEALEIEVVAEGIERPEQALWLRRNGVCKYGQGYLWSRPIPWEDFVEMAGAGAKIIPPGMEDLIRPLRVGTPMRAVGGALPLGGGAGAGLPGE